MRKKFLTIIMAAVLATTSFTGAAGYFGTVDVMAAEKSNIQVKLNKSTLNLYMNQKAAQSVNLKATVSGNKSGVKWSSSNKNVAKVSSGGKVTAVSKGTAVIKATSKANKKAVATCKVTVKNPTKKVTSKSKIVRAFSDYDYVFCNLKITSYSQMKKVIKNYKAKTKSIDKELLKQLESYNQSYFKKNALLLNSTVVYAGMNVTVGNVTKQLKEDGKFQINVAINVKDNRETDSGLYPDDALYCNHCFIEISQGAAALSDDIVYREQMVE